MRRFLLYVQHILRTVSPELVFWITGLIYLSWIDPANLKHFGFCLFQMLGLESCPGCGFGKAISLLIHGNVVASLKTHPLALFALPLILYRILSLLRDTIHKFRQSGVNVITLK
jgi:hypothetical protein